MAAKKKEAQKAAEWMYEVLRNPVVTEKSTLGGQHGQVTFKVAIGSTKPQIKAAIEGLFGVKVKAVNTSIQKGKTKRFKGVKGTRSDEKKAIVTLEEGQVIDVGTGL
jgi:large subunit ribosomal protein L23